MAAGSFRVTQEVLCAKWSFTSNTVKHYHRLGPWWQPTLVYLDHNCGWSACGVSLYPVPGFKANWLLLATGTLEVTKILLLGKPQRFSTT